MDILQNDSPTLSYEKDVKTRKKVKTKRMFFFILL